MQRAFLEEKYEILETLEDDGQQAAFKVRHRMLGELCALRMRPHQLEEPERRAIFDARLPWFTRLKHPHITTIFDVAIAGSVALMESAWLEARRLDDLITASGEMRAATDIGWQLQVADQMLDAVGYLHAADWAHGSLLPEKFLVQKPLSGPPLASLSDPGFARLVGAPEKTTAGGLLMKRLRHAPPERFVGEEKEPTRAGDIYVLGLILYELLTGHYPIAGDQPTSIAAGHLLRPPLDFAESDPQGRLPGEVRHALLCCLAKAPEARFMDIEQLRGAFAAGRAALPLGAETRVAVEVEAKSAEVPVAGRAGIRQLLEEAKVAAGRDDFTAARHALRRGQDLAPEDPRLGSLLRDVERAARDQQLQERRRRQLDEAAGEIEHLLALGNWQTARTRLETAGQQVGSSDRLRALERRLEEFERRHAAHSESGSRADDLVERARRLSQAESFDSALDTLSEALEMAPDHAAARTLSESVAALAAMHRREGDRQATIESTTRVIREHLDKGEPGRAMAQLNRAVARYGNRSDLQELRFAIAEAFLREEVGEPALAPPAMPPRQENAQDYPRDYPEGQPEGYAGEREHMRSEVSTLDQEAGDEPLSEGVDGFELAGLGESAEADSAEDQEVAEGRLASESTAPAPWLDLRRPQAWILILALMAAVALFGHWLASQGAADVPLGSAPAMEAEDVRPTTPQ